MIPESEFAGLAARLVEIVGERFVLSDDASRVFYAQDVYARELPAALVVRPANSAEVAAVVASATGSGCAVIGRGGAMSYTRGGVPVEERTVVVDTSRLDRVLEINDEDMYVTVECGCTWKSLHEALERSALRTPYWGTLSGIFATVGGSVSQNSIFWGSGQFGCAADSVIALEVVLADGSVLKTGAALRAGSRPFFRYFGPDLTGLFLCDSGALGIKTSVTLRLMPVLKGRRYGSFDFATQAQLLRAMSGISRRGLAMECFGFDPNLQSQRMKRESLAADFRALGGVMKAQGSITGALKEGARVALHGRRYMKDVQYSLHVMLEERSEAAAEDALQSVRGVCRDHGGREIEASIPKIARANPFGPVNNMVGPEGERWLPIHGLFPHSAAVGAGAAIEALFDRHREAIERFGIITGYLYTYVSTHALVIEPVLFWPDELTEIHEHSIDAEVYARFRRFPADPEAREAVARIRAELVGLLGEHGAVHMQIGKGYPYAGAIAPEAARLVAALKRVVDPERRMNPGALEL